MKYSCNYSYDHYRETLNSYISNGYTINTVDDYFNKNIKSKKSLILRHDIDYSVKDALTMAEVEYSMGIKSSYYVMLHSGFYDILLDSNLDDLLRIKKLGHTIGLHYQRGADFNKFYKDISILTAILKQKIESYAWHSPQLPENFGFAFNSAYDKNLLKEFKYISDSCNRWREGCFCNWLNKEDKLYVLTHALWWGNAGENWEEKLNDCIRDCKKDFDKFTNIQIGNIRNYLKGTYVPDSL